MTKFTFPDDKPFELVFKSKVKALDIDDELNTIGSHTKITNYKITQSIKNYLNFMSDNNLLPYLPSKIKVVYVNEENKIFNSLSNLLKRKYAYPASMLPDNATLYISKDFELSNNKLLSRNSKNQQEKYIIDLRNIFNQNNQQVLEYVFGHELGHFFLLIKNSNKNLLTSDVCLQRIARNIEEGFSEAFSLQLMYIKNSKLNTKNIEKYRHDSTLSRFDFINDRTLDKEDMLNHFNSIGFEKLIDTYDFKILYKELPIKNANGKIETDINIVYEQCYQLSLKNNKSVIEDMMNNENFQFYELSQKLYEKIQLSSEKEHNNLSELIDSVHEKFQNIGFSTKKMKMLRESFLNNKTEIRIKHN